MTNQTTLSKKISTKGDWCACCGCLVDEGTEMIRISTAEGNLLFKKEHLLEWINTDIDKANIILPQRPRREYYGQTTL